MRLGCQLGEDLLTVLKSGDHMKCCDAPKPSLTRQKERTTSAGPRAGCAWSWQHQAQLGQSEQGETQLKGERRGQQGQREDFLFKFFLREISQSVSLLQLLLHLCSLTWNLLPVV